MIVRGPPRGARRRRLRHQHGPGRRDRGDAGRLRGARSFGLRQTIADTLGVGGVFRALRTFPVLARHRRRHAGGLPRRLAAQLHQPDGDERLVPVAGRALGSRPSACATASTGPSPASATWSACRSRRSSYRAAGVNHQAWLLRWEHGGKDLYPLLDARIAGGPGAAPAGPRRHVPPPGLLPDRDQRALLGVRAVVPARRARGRPAAHPGGRLPGISEENVAEYEQTRTALAAGELLPLETSATEYAPQVIHSMVTGTPAHHPRQRGEPRPDRQPAAGRRRRGALLRRRPRPAPPGRGRAAAAVRRAQRGVPRRRRAHGPGRPGGRPAAGAAGRDDGPEHRRRRFAWTTSGTCATP